MTKINLREQYPDFYKTDYIIEVPDEVAAVMKEHDRLEAAYRRRTYYHKAHYSLDRGDGIEYDALFVSMTPCELYDLRGKIVKAERRIAILTERGEMWEQYNQYKSIHKQLAKVKPEKREQFEQRHSRELILYDAAARYLKELKDSGEGITPKAWQREIDQLAAGKQTDTLAMKSMREELKAVERLRKTAEQLSRQERDKSHDRGPER